MSKVLTVDKIVKEYGYKVSTLKYMRDNSQANAGDTPSWYPVMNRPHYPTDQFELWHQRSNRIKAIGLCRNGTQCQAVTN